MLLSKKIAFCAMMVAIATICLVLTNILTTTTVFLCLFSTLFVMIAVLECGYRFGILTYGAVCALGYILVADKLMMVGYIAAIGYYPLLKHWLERRPWPLWGRWLAKLFCFGAVMLLLRVLAAVLFELYLEVWLLLLGWLLFAVYDFCLTVGIQFYALRIRVHLLK